MLFPSFFGSFTGLPKAIRPLQAPLHLHALWAPTRERTPLQPGEVVLFQ